jgi:hypothetical protein
MRRSSPASPRSGGSEQPPAGELSRVCRDGVVKGRDCGLSGAALGCLMSVRIEPGEGAGDRGDGAPDLSGRHGLIEESRLDGALGIKRLGEDDGAAEVRWGEPLAADLDRRPGHREAASHQAAALVASGGCWSSGRTSLA